MVASSLRTEAMAETIDQVAERLARLELTVAQGFHECATRDTGLSLKIDLGLSALSQKVDINTESLRNDLQTVLNAVDSLSDEFRRTAEYMRKEHAADREVFRLTLVDHAHRLNKLEQ